MRYKYFLAGILVISLVMLLSIILIPCTKRERVINVKTLDNFNENVETLNKKISRIKKEDCKNSLNTLLNNTKSTYYENDIKLDKYYKNYFKEKTFLSYYSDIKNNCKIKDDDYDRIYITALSSTNYPNKIREEYLSRHEIRIKDNLSINDLVIQDDNIGTYTNKSLELRVISELLEVIK